MLDAKQASKQKRRKAVPMLGAAGLSLSLATGASGGPMVDMTTQSSGMGHEVTLIEEEISDVSLATFYVFDKENVATLRPGVRLAMGAGCGCGGCSGCGGCGGCWTGTDYTTSVFQTYAYPPHHSIRPAHKYAHALNRTRPAPAYGPR
jgi:hypothetical protein